LQLLYGFNIANHSTVNHTCQLHSLFPLKISETAYRFLSKDPEYLQNCIVIGSILIHESICSLGKTFLQIMCAGAPPLSSALLDPILLQQL